MVLRYYRGNLYLVGAPPPVLATGTGGPSAPPGATTSFCVYHGVRSSSVFFLSSTGLTLFSYLRRAQSLPASPPSPPPARPRPLQCRTMPQERPQSSPCCERRLLLRRRQSRARARKIRALTKISRASVLLRVPRTKAMPPMSKRRRYSRRPPWAKMAAQLVSTRATCPFPSINALSHTRALEVLHVHIDRYNPTLTHRTHNADPGANGNGGSSSPDGDAGATGSGAQYSGRPRDPQADPRYKTRMCRTVSSGELCQYADKCSFAHTQDEMRPSPFGMGREERRGGGKREREDGERRRGEKCDKKRGRRRQRERRGG